MILIKVKNPNILNSVKDYCEQHLLHGIETVIECSAEEVESNIPQDDLCIVVTEGTLFHDHLDEDFLKSIYDLDMCQQIGSGPVYIVNNQGQMTSRYRMSTREFSKSENKMFKFLGYNKKEQAKNLLEFDRLHPRSFYYPLATSKPKQFQRKNYSNYISVANGVESLQRLINVYQDIKTITFYDISITALLFTELLIKSYNGNYRNFVEVFDKAGGRKWTTLDVDSADMYAPLSDPDIMPILEHIRNNCEVNYCIGDITRPGVVKSFSTRPTLVNLSNVFEYSHNFIRREEKSLWYNSLPVNVDVLS
jgi:hypothetical protein